MEIISKEKPIKAYKAFDKKLKCKGFQYEVGKEYHTDGEIKLCENGFHACKNPMGLFSYYDMTESRFAEVELWGDIIKDDTTSKMCASDISIKRELKLSEFIGSIVQYFNRTMPQVNDDSGRNSRITSRIDGERLSSSGEFSNIMSLDNNVCVLSKGNNAKICLSGYFQLLVSTGITANIMSNGNSSRMCSTGNHANITSSEIFADILSMGDETSISSIGSKVKIVSLGDYANINSSGESAKILSQGNHALIMSSGTYVTIKSSGDNATIHSGGDLSHIDSTGKNAIITCSSDSMVKAKKGAWITLYEQDYDYDKSAYFVKNTKTVYVDGERIKEDKWYNVSDDDFF